MSEDLIRYDILTQDALRSMIAKLLDEVSRTGLPGDHHFFITFDTRSPDVKLSSRMKEKYPEEMTIVVQHRFWDMEIKPDRFQIGLSFDEIPEMLVIPFAAIKGFYDPSVKFGLQFEVQNEGLLPAPLNSKNTTKKDPGKKSKRKKKKIELLEEDIIESDVEIKSDSLQESASDDDQEGADVVSLDAFRKKK